MREGCSASPVLMTAVDVEDFGRTGAAQIIPQSRALIRYRLAGRHTGERKDRGRVEERRKRRRVARRLCESMIEAAAPGTSSVHEKTVERDTTALIGVESLVQIVADEPAGLGNPVADSITDARDGRRVVLEVRHHVAHRREPSPDDYRILGAVDDLVDLPRLESLCHVHRA